MIALCGLAAWLAQPCAAAADKSAYVPGEVLVGVRVATDHAGTVHKLKLEAGDVAGYQREIHAYRLKLKAGLSVEEAVARLSKHAEVAYAEPNHILEAYATPNDTYYASSQYAPQITAANQAWGLWQPKAQIVVAIVDTGIQNTHPDLTNKILRDASGVVGYDAFLGARSQAADDHGHGTHCAGITAAQVNNGTGIAGIAGWTGAAGASDVSTKLMPVKVLDSAGSGTDATVANGVIWAANNGAKVISLSLGGGGSTTLSNAMQYAWDKGCIIVAAAGNSGVATPSYPAAYPTVIAVAATDSTDTLASYSNYGAWVQVAAPGSNIYSTYPGSAYALMSGTSMATPHVAGEAALVWAHNPALTNADLKRILLENVDPYLPYAGHTIAVNAGRINVYRAIRAASGPTAPAAPTGLTATAGDAKVTLGWTASAGATGYNVKRSTTTGGPYTTIGTGVFTTSYTDTAVTNGTAYYYVVSATNANGESSNSNESGATPHGAVTASAAFVKSDATTKGGWQGVYGSQGYSLANLGQSLPVWATLGMTGQSAWTWAGTTTDVRGLQKPTNPADRIAACWYAAGSFTLDLDLADGATHQVALYGLDWDKAGRAEKVEVLDAATGAVLNTQTLSGFQNGTYLVWNMKGHVKIRVTMTGPVNAVLSGLFVDPAGGGAASPPAAPASLTATGGDAKVTLGWSASAGATGYNVKRSATAGGPYANVATGVTATSYVDTGVTNGTAYYYVVTATNGAGEGGKSNEASATPRTSAAATFVKADTTTKGNWQGVYGASGYSLAQSSQSLPVWAALSVTGQSVWTWAGSTGDVRGLQKPTNPADRIAACWYSAGSFTLDLNLTDGLQHQVALYGLDWDGLGRAQKVEVLDAANGAVLNTQSLSGFSGGTHLVWSVKGHVQFRITRTGGQNAVLSGLFVD
jgi:thermitase